MQLNTPYQLVTRAMLYYNSPGILVCVGAGSNVRLLVGISIHLISLSPSILLSIP